MNAWLYLRPPTQRWPELASTAAALRALPGVTEAVPGFETVYVEYDPARVTASRLRRAASGPPPPLEGRSVTVPVEYSGPDLSVVARHAGLSVPEVARRHAAARYRVQALGFLAGFPFLTGTPPELHTPRRSTPRARVPAHALALAGAQSGIYPAESPGGWRLLGHSLTAVYDPGRAEPFLLRPGDTVRFLPETGPPPPPAVPLALLPARPARPLLRVLTARGATVQDRGRPGAAHLGLPRAGPADPQGAAHAARLLGNAPETPLLEVPLGGLSVQILAGAVLALAGAGARARLDGEPLRLPGSFAVRPGQVLRLLPGGGVYAYLSLPGGVQSRGFLGSASTDPRAGLGRTLRAGDVLGGCGDPLAPLPGRHFAPHRGGGTLWLDVGLLEAEDWDDPQVRALLETPLTVGSGDRVGVALTPAWPLPAAPGGGVRPSQGGPVGALQVPPGGQVFALLCGRGTLGGYRAPLWLTPGGPGRLAQALPGRTVRLRRTSA